MGGELSCSGTEPILRAAIAGMTNARSDNGGRRPAPLLREQVVAKLRRAITRGQFAPGGRLVEREMCELLGVSRTLVREALRQLEAEGWVQILPNRGPFVADMTPARVRELYEVRGALEGLAAQLCAERATPQDLARMAEAVETMAAAQARGDLAAHRRSAALLYDILRQAAGNEMLRTQLQALNARLDWMRAVALSRPARAGLSVQEERNLLAALRARDGAKARALCEQHMRAGAEAVIAALAEREATAGAA